MAHPTIEGRFAVDATGREMAITCWGNGARSVVLDGGASSGYAQFANTHLVSVLAYQTRVCVYNHAGGADSDPAPNKPRGADDVVGDLHALLTAADVPGPYVMAGSSFGGFVVAYYAAKYPDETAGVVLLDTPAPQAHLTIDEFPEGAWDYPGNVEHLDVLAGFENRFGRHPVPFEAPLVVITATEGQGGVEDQGDYWLPLSPDSRQLELDGGHEIYLDQSEAVAAVIMGLVTN